MKKIKIFSVIGAIVFLLLLSSFYLNKKTELINEVNVYSSRKEELLHDLFKKFTQNTGIKVNYINDESAQLINRIDSEGKNSKADVFLTADAVNLILAKKKNLLEKIDSEILNSSIPVKFRDGDGYWFGFTKRARIIVYNKELIKKNELSTYEDLANPKWHNQILVRSSNSPYNQSLIAFMIANYGEERAKLWVRGLVKNMARKPSGGDTDQIYAVSSGEGGIAIVNSYYFGRILASNSSKDKKAIEKLDIFFPDQLGNGAMINISGGGVVKNAKNKKNAIALLEFLTSKDAQKMYAEVNQEYPIVEGVPNSKILSSWGHYKESNMPLQVLEKYLNDAIRIADEEGWR